MDWITDALAIGDYLEASDAALLRREGIRSILGLIPALKGITPAELGVAQIAILPLIDGPGNDRRHFVDAINSLELLVRDAAPVLVHCQAGRSPSPAVVAGYLMRTRRIDATEALALIAAQHDIVVVPELRDLLERLEE
jgi:hypothetical protein